MPDPFEEAKAWILLLAWCCAMYPALVTAEILWGRVGVAVTVGLMILGTFAWWVWDNHPGRTK